MSAVRRVFAALIIVLTPTISRGADDAVRELEQKNVHPSRTSAQHIAASHVVNVRIDRPASEVWAALFDRAGWMPSFVSKQQLRGPKDVAGEQSLYTLRDEAGNSGQRLEEILLAIDGERLVIRLGPPDGHGTSAVGEYRLTRRGRATDLEFNVYWWEDIREASTPEQLQALEDSYVKQTDAKIRADIARLKRHLETTE